MAEENTLLWWVLPDELAGMPMPYLSVDRRLARGGTLDAYPDELEWLYSVGIRSVVCLLNMPSDQIYHDAGFAFLCSYIPDGHPPSREQAESICRFIDEAPKAVAVHCEGGIGRTGTILAAYLIHQGETPEAAIRRVREAEPAAIETGVQVRFLMGLGEG